MKESSFCVAMGKCSGSMYRAVAENGSRIGRYMDAAARTVTDEARMMWLRLGNLVKSIKTNSQLAHWELKRKDDFAKLGEELFRRKESELERLVPDEDFKAVLQRVRKAQDRIRGIEDDRQAQNKRMREMTVFRHAAAQLRSPEPRIRRAALRVLEKLNRSEALPHIASLLKDPDDEVRARAREAINKISGPPEPIQGKPQGQLSGGTIP